MSSLSNLQIFFMFVAALAFLFWVLIAALLTIARDSDVEEGDHGI